MERIGQLVVEHDLLNLNQAELDQMKPDGGEWGGLILGDTSAALYLRSLYRVGQSLFAMVRSSSPSSADS